jgi:hypothetical protein
MKIKNTTLAIYTGAAVLAVLVLWRVGAGLYRCYAYHRVIASSPEALSSLEGKFNELDIPSSTADSIVSLGYAQLALNPESVRRIELTTGPDPYVVIYGDEWTVMFAAPHTADRSPTEPNTLPSWASPDIFTRTLLGHDFGVRVAKTTPKKYSELFYMSKTEFYEYLRLATLKSQNILNQNGIGAFETPHIRGIVRFGQAQESNLIAAQVYSKGSDIRQALLARCSDREVAKEALFQILGSYTFIVTEVPEPKSLRMLILSALADQPASNPAQ